MKVLFIGGTGVISSACSRVAVEAGIQLFHLRRGKTARQVPLGVKVLVGDIRSSSSVRAALGQQRFDVVVDFIAFTPEHIALDIELFRGRTSQFVFISSASAYQTPPTSLPCTESTPLDNPVWQYSRDKIGCEEALLGAYRRDKFPFTIVRPSHTYDRTLFPFHGGYTVVHRMRQGKPVIVQGDGSSLWTLTHHHDFARAFVALLGNARAIGESFHITSDEWLSWDQIHYVVAAAAGGKANLVHLPSEVIAKVDRVWGDSLLGDKTHSRIFDNSKVKRLVPGWQATIPFSRGAEEIVAYHDADPLRQVVDGAYDATMDRLVDIASRL
ncbi:MAG: NAD-dependent epimerase/dehydratase family protein [Polyangia bacterium]|jgi:nucleoside-diphosphate-sugar epimerase